MTHLGAQYLAELEASAKKATQGEWEIIEAWRAFHMVGPFMLDGPTVNDDGRHIANASPDRIAAIADHLASEKARADAAEAERDALKAKDAIADDEARDGGTCIGIALSIAYLIRDVGEDTYAEELWRASGLKVDQLELLGLDDYDLDHIRELVSHLEKQEGEK